MDYLDWRVRHPAQRYCLRALADTAGRGDRQDRAEANSKYINRYFDVLVIYSLIDIFILLFIKNYSLKETSLENIA